MISLPILLNDVLCCHKFFVIATQVNLVSPNYVNESFKLKE